VRLKEIGTKDTVYTNCAVLHSDTVGLVFEVQRTVSEGGTIENMVSQYLVPWVSIKLHPGHGGDDVTGLRGAAAPSTPS
jgi:hypothetical protein